MDELCYFVTTRTVALHEPAPPVHNSASPQLLRCEESWTVPVLNATNVAVTVPQPDPGSFEHPRPPPTVELDCRERRLREATGTLQYVLWSWTRTRPCSATVTDLSLEPSLTFTVGLAWGGVLWRVDPVAGPMALSRPVTVTATATAPRPTRLFQIRAKIASRSVLPAQLLIPR